LSDVVLVWSSVWREVQMIAHGPVNATATPSSLASLKSKTGSAFLVQAYPGRPGKQAIKWM